MGVEGGPGFELGRWSFSPVAFLLSSVCKEAITMFLPAHNEPEQYNLMTGSDKEPH